MANKRNDRERSRNIFHQQAEFELFKSKILFYFELSTLTCFFIFAVYVLAGQFDPRLKADIITTVGIVFIGIIKHLTR